MDKELKTFQKIETGDYVVPIKDACERNGEYTESYPIGFPIFDQAMKADEKDLGGVRDGDLIVITGRSGEGKTTFCQNITLNLDKISMPSIFFSYEVIVDNLYAKFKQMGLSDEGLIFAPKKIITGNLNWVKDKIREGKEKYMVKMVFIDHIDFLSPANKTNSDQLRIVLHNITQELKTIAIEEKVIIFLLAHVKKVEGREIQMQDIAEAGGIYKLADYVFSIERATDEVQDGNQTIDVSTDEGKIKMLKNRLTGKQPYMKFKMENNIIKDFYE